MRANIHQHVLNMTVQMKLRGMICTVFDKLGGKKTIPTIGRNC